MGDYPIKAGAVQILAGITSRPEDISLNHPLRPRLSGIENITET